MSAISEPFLDVTVWNAIRVPSGDQLGEIAAIRSGTSWTRLLPSASTAKTVAWHPPFRSGPITCRSKASLVPSGDHVGRPLTPSLAAVLHWKLPWLRVD